VRSCTVFIDESGDLGFGAGSTRHITLAAVLTKRPITVERIPKRIRERHLRKTILRKPELKFHNSDDWVRKQVLRLLARSSDVRIVSLCADKTMIRRVIEQGKDEACAFLFATLAKEIVRSVGAIGSLDVVIDDRPCNRTVDDEFDRQLVEQFETEREARGLNPSHIRVSRLDSRRSRGLQVADFVAGAVQKKYEHGDTTYSRIVAGMITGDRTIAND